MREQCKTGPWRCLRSFALAYLVRWPHGELMGPSCCQWLLVLVFSRTPVGNVLDIVCDGCWVEIIWGFLSRKLFYDGDIWLNAGSCLRRFISFIKIDINANFISISTTTVWNFTYKGPSLTVIFCDKKLLMLVGKNTRQYYVQRNCETFYFLYRKNNVFCHSATHFVTQNKFYPRSKYCQNHTFYPLFCRDPLDPLSIYVTTWQYRQIQTPV